MAFPIVGAQDFLEGRLKDPNAVGLRAPDAHTFVTILRHPAPYWLGILAYNGPLWPVHRRSVEAAGGWHQRGGAWTRPGQLIGNGPFVLAEWRPNSFIRVVRNPHYWDAAHVRLQEIRFYPLEDENAEERAVRAGQLPVTYRLPQSKVATYEREHPTEGGYLEMAQPVRFRTGWTTGSVRGGQVRRCCSGGGRRGVPVRATNAQTHGGETREPWGRCPVAVARDNSLGALER